jgi:hypothetical protein
MTTGLLDAMTGPYQGNVLPACPWGADNGKFTAAGPREHWIGHGRWFDWLEGQVDRYGAEACRFAVAPDAPFDAAATLDESLPWMEKIRELGIPAAFAAQNYCDLYGLPWDEMDVLFLAGDTAWKIGPVAHRLTIEAKERGKWVHMGRVNSLRRLRIAEWFGCDSADGTYLKFGPDINLGRLAGWLSEMSARPSLATALAATAQ